MARKYDPRERNLFKEEVPKMPEGYYSGDKPNSKLRAFVEQHLKERPYNPETDDYNVPAFDKPIETTKATAIYNMHTYWSKKPHDAIRQYIRHYTKPGDIVLDPFCGSGGTALSALIEGRKAIAIDRSPAATFITKNYCTPVDVDELQLAFEELKRKVKPEIDWLYETKCDRCGGKATTTYTVYSQVFQCQRCLEKVPLFDCVEVGVTTGKGKPKKISACPHCHNRGIVEEISTRAEKFGTVPVLVNYICEGRCKPKRAERRYNDLDRKKREYFQKYDLGKIKEIEEKKIPHWYPNDRMMHVESDTEPWGDEWRPGRNFRTVAELFTKRNVWALASILKTASQIQKPYNDILKSTVSSFLLNLSKLYKHREGGGGQPTGNYYIPQINRENEAWSAFERKYKDTFEAHCQLPILIKCSEIIVSTDNAISFTDIPSNSVDIVFTDPPYAGKYQYGELNFIWESWLQLDNHWHADEITINMTRGKTEVDWTDLMQKAMSECYRVLKPGRWLALCYHDTSEGTWSLIQDIMAEVGFLPDSGSDALYIDTGQKTYNQTQAEKVTKRDLIINFRKPKPGEVTADVAITGNEDKTTFNEKVVQIIRDYLGANPGSSKDRVYDEVVSRMVRSGQMEAHDFNELLGQIAEEAKIESGKNGGGRWYLKETELVIVDAAENAREDSAAEKIGLFINKFLKKNPGDEGVHYSDLFENYIYAIKDKPRRQLGEFLPDYFYKTEQGTWRMPASEEEEKVKREARVKGLGRRVKRYIAQLEQGAIIPEHERPNDATLAEWIRHCKRAGLYEQGKLLYEKGGLNTDNLLEEAMVNVEEDYQVCARMLSREVSKPKQRRSRKKAEE
ncbi:MAG: hypothetical protein KJ737_22925 [Proteobacteria bacterium]|nr:hypothetical protein [Pseudomonadota bacterium]